MKGNKKVVLVMHNGGRLGNQLWWMASFYAYCLEKNYIFDVRCFFEYQEYFNIKIESLWAKIFGKAHFFFEKIDIPEVILRDLFYGVFTTWSELFSVLKKSSIIIDSQENSQMTFKIFLYKRYKTAGRIIQNIYRKLFGIKKEEAHAYSTTHNVDLILLPPSTTNDPIKLSKRHTYFYGWLFRNPLGMVKYQKELTNLFTPKEHIDTKIKVYVSHLKKSYKRVIGVHVRLGDVVNEFMNNDRIAYSENEVYEILKQYLAFSNTHAEETCFIICSDGEISESNFSGLHVKITHNNPVEDLWLLSKTDYIIGADSSFAIMASFFGDIPFVVFKRGIDWDYYKDKNGFFVNKYVNRFIY